MFGPLLVEPGRTKRCGLLGGVMSLGAGFEVSNQSILGALSLSLPPLGISCSSSATAPAPYLPAGCRGLHHDGHRLITEVVSPNYLFSPLS